MSKDNKALQCQHLSCTSASHVYSSPNNLKKHMKRSRPHKCPEGCGHCTKIIPPKEKIAPNPDLKYCRHSSCTRKEKSFATTSAARHHERHMKHSCQSDCSICQLPQATKLIKEASKANKDLPAQEQIRFGSVIHNNRKSSAEVSSQELGRRQREAEHLLVRAFGCKDLKEALQYLFSGRERRKLLVDYIREDDKLTTEVIVSQEPPIDQLLVFKDRMYISDHDWSSVVHTFKLKHGTIYRLRKLRTTLNEKSGVTPTSTGNGSQRNIVGILANLFKANPPTTNKVRVKFAFDACKITKNLSEVIGVVARLDGSDKSATKSSSNCSQFLVYLGTETYEEYKEELRDIVPILNAFLKEELKVRVEDKEYTIDPYLVLDMKSLCTMLGLYSVSHPSSTYCCCWCAIMRSLLFDYSKHFQFRDIEEMKRVGAQAENRSDNYASTHEGIRNPPILDFPLHRIIPCTLHMMMAITKKLFQLLLADLKTVAAKNVVEKLCQDLDIKLWKPKPKRDNKKTYTICDIVKKSRFQRTQYLKIIKNYEKFLDAHQFHGGLYNQKVRTIWNLYIPMIARVCSLTPPKESVDTWENLGQQFSKAFVDRYTPEKFTPYMHVFVAHTGYFLKEHGEIESMANYDIETKNADNKAFVQRGSNHFGGLQGRSMVTSQQLHRESRLEQLQHISIQPVKHINKKRKANNNNKSSKRQKLNHEEKAIEQMKANLKKKCNWSTETIQLQNNPTFEVATIIAIAETNDELLKETLGLDFSFVPNTEKPPNESFH